MSSVPETLVTLDADLRTIRTLKRVDPSELLEARYDELVVSQCDAIASALQQAEIIEADSALVVVAKPFDKIDVLLAEVGPGGDLRRLVLVESKLSRNQESHRKVLAQLLDYSYRLQYEVDPERVIERAEGQTRELLEAHRETLGRLIAKGDFLLLVCGDRIQPSLVRLVKPFADRSKHTLSHLEIGMLSLALYAEPAGGYVLVPNVVGTIMRGERDVVVTVQVADAQQRPVVARVSAPEPDARPAKRWTEETFLADAQKVGTENEEDWPDILNGFRRAFQYLRERQFPIAWGINPERAAFSVKCPKRALVWVASDAMLCVYAGALTELVGEEVSARWWTALEATFGESERAKGEVYFPMFDPSSEDELTLLFAFLDDVSGPRVGPKP